MAHNHHHRGRRMHAKRPKISDTRQDDEVEDGRHPASSSGDECDDLGRGEEENKGQFDIGFDSHYDVVQARQAPGSATTVVMTVVQVVREGSTVAQFTVPTLPATVSDPQLGEVTIPAGSEAPVVVPSPPPTQAAPTSDIISQPKPEPSVPPLPPSSWLNGTTTTGTTSSSSLSTTESILSSSDTSSFSLSSELPISLSTDATSALSESAPSIISIFPSEPKSLDPELSPSATESVAFTSTPTSLLSEPISLEFSQPSAPAETVDVTSVNVPYLYPSVSESETTTSPTKVFASYVPSSSPLSSSPASETTAPPASLHTSSSSSSAISETSLDSLSSSFLTPDSSSDSSSAIFTISSTISPSVTSSEIASSTSAFSSTSSSWSSTESSSGDPSNGGSEYGGPPGGAPDPTASSEGDNDSDDSGVPVPTVVGGVIGGIAGLILLIVLALLLFRHRKRKLSQTRGITPQGPSTGGSGAAAAAGAGAGAALASPTSEVTERSSDTRFSGALLGASRAFDRWRDSGRPLGAEEIAATQRGFQKLGGRKITSVLESGGDGYDDHFGRSSGVPSSDSGGVSKEVGAGILGASFTRRGTTGEETGAGSSRQIPSPPLGRPPSETSNHSEKVTIRPSPARTAVATPVEVHPGTDVSTAARTGSISITGPPPPPLPLARISSSDAIGRSHSSADGSRASRFTEGI